MKTLGTRLREARKLRGMSQSELATRIGTSSNQICMIEGGQSGSSLRTMVAAASTLNVSLDFLAGLVKVPDSARELLYKLQQKDAQILDMRSTYREVEPRDDIAHIELMDVHTSAGAVEHGEGVKTMIEFSGRWLQDRGLEPNQCRVISVVGESMEPTLADGSQILVDLSRRARRHDRICVVEIDNELVVKRIVRTAEGGYLLVSDNPDKTAFPTTPWPEGARLIGEVKWHGQSFQKERPADGRPDAGTRPARNG